MYVITGASGNTGKNIVLELLAKGKEVRVIARHADKLKPLTDKGAEPMVGDLTDGRFLNLAYAGADAVYLLIPPNQLSDDVRGYQKKVADNHLRAIQANNVKRVVLLSSVGAHLRKGAGVVDGLGYLEEIFSTLRDVHVLNLRPSSFMENLFNMIIPIKQMGIAGSPIKADLRFPMVATADISAVAAKRLLDLKFKGNTIEYILGPADITYNEVISVIGKAIGKPGLKYVQFSYEDAKKAMVQSGYVSENMADLYNQMQKSFNSGKALNDYKRTPENSTPTSIQDFARTFAAVYNQG